MNKASVSEVPFPSVTETLEQMYRAKAHLT